VCGGPQECRGTGGHNSKTPPLRRQEVYRMKNPMQEKKEG